MTNQSDLSREPEQPQRSATASAQKEFQNLPRMDSDTDETIFSGPQPTTPSKEEQMEKVEENTKYVTGVRLMILLVTVTLVVFLLLLDLSIISTVSAQNILISLHLHAATTEQELI